MVKGIGCLVLIILPSLVMCNPDGKKMSVGDVPPADELSNFFEGDILPDNQAYVGGSNRRTKISLWDNARIWPGGNVPYKIFDRDDDNELVYDLVMEAIDEINQYDCVSFQPDNSNDGDYVNIVLGEYLSSQLGHQRTGAQDLTVKNSTLYVSRFHIVHELMHSLGFGHEHNRPDRDDYVEILWDNLEKSTDEPYFTMYNYPGNFTKDNGEYDFMSLMHATSHISSIAINEYDPVIKRKNSDEVISGHSELTDLDIKRLKRIYSCDVCTGDNDGADDTYRYPGDCTKFYKCVNGKPTVMDCGLGPHGMLHINTNEEHPYCDYPENAKCTEFFDLWD